MAKQKRDAVAQKSLTRARIVRDQSVKSIEDIRSIAVLADQNRVPKEDLTVRMQNLDTLLQKVHTEQDVILDALVELDRVDEFSNDASISDLVEKAYYDILAVASRILSIAPNEKV
jgi:hypothetical protein